MDIRTSTIKDLPTILDVELAAFHNNRSIKNLITDIFDDPTAQPLVSLLAWDDQKAVGHILFSKAKIRTGCGFCNLHDGAYILAPMAVIPDYQKKGIGGELINAGLLTLKEQGVKHCFVLGHKTYYPKFGFIPNAADAGWPPPYDLDEEIKDAWMWQKLNDDHDTDRGMLICSNTLMQKKYWK